MASFLSTDGLIWWIQDTHEPRSPEGCRGEAYIWWAGGKGMEKGFGGVPLERA